jgi:hypothetical protein
MDIETTETAKDILQINPIIFSNVSSIIFPYIG